MEREHRVDRIVRLIDSGLVGRSPDTVAAIESSVWADIYESYEHGWIDTIEEAQERFLQWRVVNGIGRAATGGGLPPAS